MPDPITRRSGHRAPGETNQDALARLAGERDAARHDLAALRAQLLPAGLPDVLATVDDVRAVCEAAGMTQARTVGMASRWQSTGLEILATDDDIGDEPFVQVHAIGGGWIAAFKEGTPSALLWSAIEAARGGEPR